MENENKSGPESAPPLKAVFKWADSVTFTGLPGTVTEKGTIEEKEEWKNVYKQYLYDIMEGKVAVTDGSGYGTFFIVT